MTKKVLIVYAHPEPTSLTRHLVDVSIEALTAQGHDVIQSDLYGMRWKAVFDAEDFPSRSNPERLSYIMESGHAMQPASRRRMSPRSRPSCWLPMR